MRPGRLLALLVLSSLAACAHHGPPAPDGPARELQSEAARIGRVAYEDDFQEARLVFQALPVGTPARVALREKLLHYLLDPVTALDPAGLRREVRDLESDDVYDRIFDSFREALGLYEPAELWSAPPGVTAAERALLEPAARLVVAIFSPRGADQQLALAAATLATLDPVGRQWSAELDQVIRWTEEASAVGDGGGGFRRAASAVDVLEGALGDWPAPPVVSRLDALYGERQKKFASVLRRPVGGGEEARRALGELLLAHGEEMQRAVLSVAALYLRAGLVDRAAARAAAMAGEAGDDPELRALLDAAARPKAEAADYLALARRFLPRIEILGGTASDAPDPLVAFRVLEAGVARNPADADLLVLDAHVARMLSAPFLAIRHLEEAEAVLDRNPAAAARAQQARISGELLELYFVRCACASTRSATRPPSARPMRSAAARRRRAGASISRART
jgi:hypothetical protein